MKGPVDCEIEERMMVKKPVVNVKVTSEGFWVGDRFV